MEMDTPHIVKHVAKLDRIRLILKFVFAGFSHGISRITLLFATTSEETSTWSPRDYAESDSFQRDTIIILHFLWEYQVYFLIGCFAVYIPQAKAWGFDGRVLNFHTFTPRHSSVAQVISTTLPSGSDTLKERSGGFSALISSPFFTLSINNSNPPSRSVL